MFTMPETAARDHRYYTYKGLKSCQYYARDDLSKSQKVSRSAQKNCDYHVQEDRAKSLDIMAKYGSKSYGYNH